MTVARAAFAPEPESAWAARRFVESTLQSSAFSASTDVVCLLTSELVANAVLHAHTPFELTIDLDADVVLVAVHDGDARSPQPSADPGTEATCGRGLYLVDELSAEWGVLEDDLGKSVWFALMA